MRIQTDESWSSEVVSGLPPRWAGRLLRKWRNERVADGAPVDGWLGTPAARMANIKLREIVGRLSVVRLSLDADDDEVCARAAELARYTLDVGGMQTSVVAARAGMESYVRSCHIEPPCEDVEDRPAIARMTCPDWWRRKLRGLHAAEVESAAIGLGYVNKKSDLYVSNESLERRRQQNRRNAAMMDSTVMRNELDQEYKLSELAALGTGNKSIRRGELMVRIAGMESVAVECGHAGLFLTLTCPSRMHKYISVDGKVFENKKYDETTPRDAQKYLGKCWSRVRARLARMGIRLYGFRIAEPHHDGCPHWHMLVFHEKNVSGLSGVKRSAVGRIVATFRRYFLADSRGEAGAKKHRVGFEVIDWSRGTAAGYIAKYVAKNIDGMHVENDLFGNPAMETSLRVEAWASLWGIRQFQPIGGAPVGVWRELRRVREVPEGAPEHLIEAHVAVNKTEAGGADFGAYIRAQGGALVGRDYRIRLSVEPVEELNRYGEARAPRVVGVETSGGEYYQDGIVQNRFRLVEWFVASVRHVWEVVRGGVRAAMKSPPWTRVNNCTRGGDGGGEFIGRGSQGRGVVGHGGGGVCEKKSDCSRSVGIGNFAIDRFGGFAFGCG